MTNHTKKPLYRKVNTRARGVHHHHGQDYDRHANDRENILGTMHSKTRRGLDYTPLFRFLLSKVGQPFDDIFSEASSRLDHTDPIFWLVAKQEHLRQPFVRIGESSYYSGLYIDDEGLLQRVDPNLTAKSMTPLCTCCTHTFNGTPFS